MTETRFEGRRQELQQAISENDQRRNTSIANIQQQLEAEKDMGVFS